MNPFRNLQSATGMVTWRTLRARIAYCPICDGRRIFIRLQDNEIASRCLTCRASAVSESIVSVVRTLVPDIAAKDFYELSSRGPLFAYLKARAKSVTSSEFYFDLAPGDFRDGIQCQDVQHLTHESNRFNVCTSTEVFEHVPDDAQAFSEMLRVLRPGGLLLFTVPLRDAPETLERAVLLPGGEVKHLLAPEYHGDPIRDSGRILAFRTYGRDIVDRLLSAGFSEARIVAPSDDIPWGYARPVIVATKGNSPR